LVFDWFISAARPCQSIVKKLAKLGILHSSDSHSGGLGWSMGRRLSDSWKQSQGGSIVGVTAVLGVSLCPLQIPLYFFDMSSFPAWITIFTAFDLITLWLLFSPKHRNSKRAK
jgi:hypothetical protein